MKRYKKAVGCIFAQRLGIHEGLEALDEEADGGVVAVGFVVLHEFVVGVGVEFLATPKAVSRKGSSCSAASLLTAVFRERWSP